MAEGGVGACLDVAEGGVGTCLDVAEGGVGACLDVAEGGVGACLDVAEGGVGSKGSIQVVAVLYAMLFACSLRITVLLLVCDRGERERQLGVARCRFSDMSRATRSAYSYQENVQPCKGRH
jgi:hypothetical protein